MPIAVCGGAMCMCTFGTAPSTLMVTPENKTMGNMPYATIMDYKPMVNVMPFAMCNSVANPATKRPPPVFFTPAPCVPNTTAPWTPGSPTVMIGNKPALQNSSQLMCTWGGVITFTNPGQMQVQEA